MFQVETTCEARGCKWTWRVSRWCQSNLSSSLASTYLLLLQSLAIACSGGTHRHTHTHSLSLCRSLKAAESTNQADHATAMPLEALKIPLELASSQPSLFLKDKVWHPFGFPFRPTQQGSILRNSHGPGLSPYD